MTNLLEHPGHALVNLLNENLGDVVIISPFIKVDALKRLLDLLDDKVRIQCITRWLLPELASGVSDIEIFDMLSPRGNASIHLRNDLHAKYYRRGPGCLIGSANLTLAGMGWKAMSNLEILTSVSQTVESMTDFESSVLRNSIAVDREIYEDIKLAVQELDFPAAEVSSQRSPVSLELWLPMLRNPQDLYTCYRGRQEELHQASRNAALQDLEVLSPPAGLSEKNFNRVVGELLLQAPLLRDITQLARSPQRFGVFRDFVRSRVSDRDPTAAWQTTMRWLLYFCADRYDMFTSNYSEVFGRR